MSSDSIISISGVSKCFRIYEKSSDRLKQFFVGRWKQVFSEFWALYDVSFEIPRGACYGIVGRNGAGKSTLLQIIAGTLTPSSGEVNVRGRVAALLELGTGFNPDFSGRENIFLNAAILGLSKAQIEERFERIVAFADIGTFLEQPVKTYSTGMMVRLAFAVAVHVDPEVLIIDEALAVGDAKFQAKCFRKFQDFREADKTILFVTHSTELIVRHCDQAILLEKGRLLRIGDPKSVSNYYLDMLFGAAKNDTTTCPIDPAATSLVEKGVEFPLKQPSETKRGASFEERLESRPGYNAGEYRWGVRGAEILDCVLTDQEGRRTNHFNASGVCKAVVTVLFHENIARPIYALTLKTPDGVVLYGHNTRDVSTNQNYRSQKKGDVAVLAFSFQPRLITGHYLLSLGVVEQSPQNDEDVVVLDRRYDVLEIFVTNYDRGFGLVDLGMSINTVNV